MPKRLVRGEQSNQRASSLTYYMQTMSISKTPDRPHRSGMLTPPSAQKRKASSSPEDIVYRQLRMRQLSLSFENPSSSMGTTVPNTLAPKHRHERPSIATIGSRYSAMVDTLDNKSTLGKINSIIEDMATTYDCNHTLAGCKAIIRILILSAIIQNDRTLLMKSAFDDLVRVTISIQRSNAFGTSVTLTDDTSNYLLLCDDIANHMDSISDLLLEKSNFLRTLYMLLRKHILILDEQSCFYYRLSRADEERGLKKCIRVIEGKWEAVRDFLKEEFRDLLFPANLTEESDGNYTSDEYEDETPLQGPIEMENDPPRSTIPDSVEGTTSEMSTA